jgi:hypothetical protein
LKHPLKRRIGMRYSNEFYFVTPAGLVEIAEIPAECGLVEAGLATPDEWKRLIGRQAGFFNFDPDNRQYCLVRVPAHGAIHGPDSATGCRHAATSTPGI